MRLAAALLLVSLAASVAFAVLTLLTRPLENTEGCILFEASRIRSALPLYVDPILGAYDYGPVPARYYVLYAPLWAAVVSLAPEGVAPAAARVASTLVWYGVLSWLAWSAHRQKRPLGVLLAVFVGGVYTLTLYGASARPDALAVALAAIALQRTVRAKRPDPFTAGLFAFAACAKPNVVGLGLGVAARALATPRRSRGVLLTTALLGIAALTTLRLTSGGVFWRHLASATLQPLSLEQWTEQIRTRALFFAFPLSFALSAGIASRDEGVRTATLALGTSIAWTLVSLAKIGSTTCYWMEPCVGAIVVLAHAPLPPLSRRSRTALAIAVPLQALGTGVASVRSSVESILSSPAKARVLEDLRRGLPRGSLLLSDDSGIEFALDGRLIDTPFQTTELILRGRFPEALWVADVQRPEIVGLVTETDLLERPLTEVNVLHDRYDVALRRVLRGQYVLSRREAGFSIYARR
jgi:hypothetical protein